MRKLSTVLTSAALLIFVTRWPLTPKQYLYHIDNVNFALALDDFHPPLHQPQPPGDTGGIAAAVLLALNPVFWLAGVANYVRVYLALGAVTIALLVWRCWNAEPGRERLFFRASAAALGFFAGFRPELGVLLLPLVASSVKIRKLPLREIVIAGLWLAATTMPWLAVTVYKSGGLVAWYRLNSAYLAAQSSHTSLLYGGTLFEATRMAAGAIYWIFLGAVSWFWIVLWTG